MKRTSTALFVSHCHSGTVTFLRASTISLQENKSDVRELSQQGGIAEYEINETTQADVIAKEIHWNDIIIVNQGAHYLGEIPETKAHFDNIGKFLNNLTRKTPKQIIIRSTPPRHKANFFERKCDPITGTQSLHFSSYLLMNMANMYNFTYLDNYAIYYERWDIHYGPDPQKDLIDCLHHCYTPQIIWPELVMLTKLIK